MYTYVRIMICGSHEPWESDAHQHLDGYRTGDVYHSFVRVGFGSGHHARSQDVGQGHAERHDRYCCKKRRKNNCLHYSENTVLMMPIECTAEQYARSS